jgi:hypothetical protein
MMTVRGARQANQITRTSRSSRRRRQNEPSHFLTPRHRWLATTSRDARPATSQFSSVRRTGSRSVRMPVAGGRGRAPPRPVAMMINLTPATRRRGSRNRGRRRLGMPAHEVPSAPQVSHSRRRVGVGADRPTAVPRSALGRGWRSAAVVSIVDCGVRLPVLSRQQDDHLECPEPLNSFGRPWPRWSLRAGHGWWGIAPGALPGRRLVLWPDCPGPRPGR